MDATTGASAPPDARVTAHHPGGPEVPGPGLDDTAEPTRFAEFALGSVCLFAYTVPRVPGNLAAGLVAVAALVFLSTVRRPTRPTVHLRWLPTACFLVLGYLVAVTVTSPDESLFGWPKRAMRLALLVLLLLALVNGRAHLPSLVRGAAFGLVLNAVAFYAGVAPAPYGELLSGYLLDKNQAGLAYAVVGLLLLAQATQPRWQVAVGTATVAFVWLSGSRTSLAALACGLLWFALRPRLEAQGRIALGVAMALVIPVIESRYALVGSFSDRRGSDQFRATIDAASQAKLGRAPFQGMGLGEAWVLYPNGDTFFFHNSYWSALVEGGYPYLAALMGVTVLMAIGPFRRGPTPSRLARAGEAANIVVLVCALRLGEVFGTTIAVIALAAGLIGFAQAARIRDEAQDAEALRMLPTPLATPTGAGPSVSPAADTVTR
ncbi:O-antigen ligase family protein [Oryzobacter telluris]|uniref:O-antigen ligase family protein n=1 Tax=Oryzobacter telluris TaxID=3149179 RepID=UPI00370D8E1A